MRYKCTIGRKGCGVLYDHNEDGSLTRVPDQEIKHRCLGDGFAANYAKTVMNLIESGDLTPVEVKPK